MFKETLSVAAVLAAATFSPMAASAATCTVGTCTDAGSAVGLGLSLGTLAWDFDDVDNGAGGTFTYESNFLNDNGATGASFTVSVQDFLSPFSSAIIEDLELAVNGQTIAITDANGGSLAGDPFAGFFDLSGTSGSLVSFSLSGTAVAGTTIPVSHPDVTFTVSAVPVPAGVVLLGTAIAGFGVARRRKNKAA